MDILQGIKRLKNSLSNEKDPDIILTTKAIMVGMTNFYFKNKKDEALEKFQKFCVNCPLNKIDPVESMQVEDSEIPELSKRMCGDCGCVLSFKVRQNIKPCQKWK